MNFDLLSLTIGMVAMLGILWAMGRKIGFLSQQPQNYASKGTPLDIRQALNGEMVCEGVVYGPLGRVTSYFVGDFTAGWKGTQGYMTEQFKYDTGAVLDRQWSFRITSDDGSFEATAPDLLGVSYGRQMGSVVKLDYKIRLPESSGGHVLNATDWMYQLENGTIVNRSQFRKFGIKLAEIVATIRKK